jgi:hypothetical protein
MTGTDPAIQECGFDRFPRQRSGESALPERFYVRGCGFVKGVPKLAESRSF